MYKLQGTGILAVAAESRTNQRAHGLEAPAPFFARLSVDEQFQRDSGKSMTSGLPLISRTMTLATGSGAEAGTVMLIP